MISKYEYERLKYNYPNEYTDFFTTAPFYYTLKKAQEAIIASAPTEGKNLSGSKEGYVSNDKKSSGSKMNNKEFEKINKEVLETVETNKKRSINEELHKKINERGEGYYYKLYRKKNGYTGTVWDEIDPKTENKASYIKKITVNNKEIKRNWSAKEIPATFIVDTNSGKVYVNSNSTKHLAQFVDGYTTQNPMLNRLNEQIILESYVNKIRKIAKNKIELNKMIILENWEFKFSIREGDEYPVLIHSQKF